MHTLAENAPLYIVMNAASGAGDAPEARSQIDEVFAKTAHRCEFLFAQQPGEINTLAQRAVEAAVRHEGAVIAAGGDGTINAVAQAALPTRRPFGVIPLGTFNYVSRAHAIPMEPAAAARALLGAQIRPMQVGRVNDRVFLVNASVGLYPQILQDREQFKRVYGRRRINAAWSTLLTLSRGYRRLVLDLDCDGKQERVRALTLFVGNNPLQLEQIGLPEADAVQHRRLAGVLLPPVGAPTLVWLALIGALGRLGESDKVRDFAFRRLIVKPLHRIGPRGVKVAFDGEVVRMQPPLEFSVSSESLMMLTPPQPPPDESGTDTGK